MTARSHLDLPQVTLLAATSVNLSATVAALGKSMEQVNFGAVKLLSDQRPTTLPGAIEWVPISSITSAAAYSDFVLKGLADHVETSHALVAQWDGYVINPEHWQPEFLDYDFIGASWPQFSDGYDVGNGGFSLRSRALLEACRAEGFQPAHPEDLAIGRYNRDWLESEGLRIAPRSVADVFSSERAGNPAESFGFHGVWHMPRLMGLEAFWKMYLELEVRDSIRHDFIDLLVQVSGGRGGIRRAARFVMDRIEGAAKQRKISL